MVRIVSTELVVGTIVTTMFYSVTLNKCDYFYETRLRTKKLFHFLLLHIFTVFSRIFVDAAFLFKPLDGFYSWQDPASMLLSWVTDDMSYKYWYQDILHFSVHHIVLSLHHTWNKEAISIWALHCLCVILTQPLSSSCTFDPHYRKKLTVMMMLPSHHKRLALSSPWGRAQSKMLAEAKCSAISKNTVFNKNKSESLW